MKRKQGFLVVTTVVSAAFPRLLPLSINNALCAVRFTPCTVVAALFGLSLHFNNFHFIPCMKTRSQGTVSAALSAAISPAVPCQRPAARFTYYTSRYTAPHEQTRLIPVRTYTTIGRTTSMASSSSNNTIVRGHSHPAVHHNNSLTAVSFQSRLSTLHARLVISSAGLQPTSAGHRSEAE